MIYWIKRGGRLFGSAVFFMVLIGMLAQPGSLQMSRFITALVVALVSGIICWFIGIIISDIILKGIITDLGDTGIDGMLEGGLVQRFKLMHERLVPGGAEMPFADMKPAETTHIKIKKKNKNHTG